MAETNETMSEAEAMHELAKQMWERYFKQRAIDELLNHSLDGYKATVVNNNGDGTLTVVRPFDNNSMTLKCPPALARKARSGDQVLVVSLGEMSNSFVLCGTDMSGFGSGDAGERVRLLDFSDIEELETFLIETENDVTETYTVTRDSHGRIVTIEDEDGFDTYVQWPEFTLTPADKIGYDNTDSGAQATNVQEAIDELFAGGGGGGGPELSDDDPLMDGDTPSPGTSVKASRADHRHQTDDSRASAAALTSHVQNTGNPHNVTAAQAGAMPSTATLDDIPNGATYAKPTAAQVAQIGTNETDIDTIEGKIPSAASTSNQLADKAFVTDSITQSTAIFRGSFATRAALLAVAWQTTDPNAANYVSNNDYAVVLDDETQNDECWRYIYVTGTGWTPQYRINESPLTQAQLDALNSGATAAIISSVADKLDKTGDGKDVTATFTAASTRANISTGEKLSVLFGKIAKWFSDLGTAAWRAATGSITSGSTDLVESGAVYTGLAGKQNKINVSGILKGDGQGGVSAATAGTDYATPDIGVYYGRCLTAATTAAKEVSIDGVASYYAGLHIRVRFDYAQEATGMVTLNVNNLGALQLRTYSGSATVVVGEWWHGTVLDIEYQNFSTPYWIIVNGPPATTSTYGRTILSSSTSSTDTDKAATPSAVKSAYDLADSKYTKPSSGIPASDIANGVIPTVPSAYTSNPAMDGTASPGNSGNWARGNHVHPSDTSRVPVYGLGKNLIDNWYFVGGGTGPGVFPVNQRGITGNSSGYAFDRWRPSTGTNFSWSLVAEGLKFINNASTAYACPQDLSDASMLLGKRVCYSILTTTGLYKNTGVLPSTFNNSGGQISVSDGTNVIGQLYVSSSTIQARLRSAANSGAITFVAVKLELGTEQTLAHQENGVWVLNEIPDYEEELVKCQTSTADPSDTYANKTLATEQQLAYAETGATASRAYTNGEYFLKNGLSARVKVAISAGATLTEGTNFDYLPGGALNDLPPTISGIAANGSVTLSVPYFAAGLIATARSTTGHASLAFVTAAAVVPLATSASITYSLSNNVLTISNSTANAVTLYIYNFNNAIKIALP